MLLSWTVIRFGALLVAMSALFVGAASAQETTRANASGRGENAPDADRPPATSPTDDEGRAEPTPPEATPAESHGVATEGADTAESGADAREGSAVDVDTMTDDGRGADAPSEPVGSEETSSVPPDTQTGDETSSAAFGDDGGGFGSEAAEAAEEDIPADWGDLSNLASPELKTFETRVYGYIDSYFAVQADSPTGRLTSEGKNEQSPAEDEWDVLNVHLMVQGAILERYRFYLNLAARSAGSPASEEPLGVRNAWVEAPLIGNQLVVRAGLTYRRFGLYNEILDAVPTFIGIEPPELFDVDHLMLTRTTNFMVHGTFVVDDTSFQYALSTGNDEARDGSVPLGGDLRLNWNQTLIVGSSGYWTGGHAGPSRGVGDGSPRGGVLNWMEHDEYWVLGAFAQLNLEGWVLQAEYWHAYHEADRDPDATLALAGADLSARQLNRFFVAGDPAQGVNTVAHYAVDTFYVRTGYRITIDQELSITPYAQVDWYSNPETVREKSVGGDAEAGIADDGSFWKLTLGGILRPIAQVALKVDGSIHIQTVNTVTEIYPELRISFSYLWELEL